MSTKDYRNGITLLMISSLRSQPQVSLIELGEWYYFPGGPRDIALWETPVQMTKGDILVAIIKRLSIWTQLFTNRVLHFFSFFFFSQEQFLNWKSFYNYLPKVCMQLFSYGPLAHPWHLPLLALSKLWALSWPQLTRSPPGSDVVPHFFYMLSVCPFLNTHQSWIPPYFR